MEGVCFSVAGRGEGVIDLGSSDEIRDKSAVSLGVSDAGDNVANSSAISSAKCRALSVVEGGVAMEDIVIGCSSDTSVSESRIGFGVGVNITEGTIRAGRVASVRLNVG